MTWYVKCLEISSVNNFVLPSKMFAFQNWDVFPPKLYDLKPLHHIGKVSVNASILYKNQEICNKTNL